MSNANFFYRQSYCKMAPILLLHLLWRLGQFNPLALSSIYPSVPFLLYLWRRLVSSIALLSVRAICLMTLTPILIHSLEYINYCDDLFTQAAPVLPTQSKRVPPDRDPLYF